MGFDGTLPFEEAHDVGHRVLGRDFEDQMNVIDARCSFNHLDFLLLGKISDDLSNLYSDWGVEIFLPVFWYNDHVVGAIPYHMAL